ncbi:MAG: lysophospholipid acyltransferase family protein [bacterium]
MSRSVVASMPQASARRRTVDFLSGLWYLGWKLVLSGLFKVLFRYRIEGRSNEPERGPFIAAANHASAIDPPLIGLVLRHRAVYMAKVELFSIPILGSWLRSVGSFPVRRGQPDRGAVRHSLKVLADGGVLVMFPEGTRSPDGRLQDPEPGAALLALRTGVPVVPVSVVNSHRAMSKSSRLPGLQQVKVIIGRPLPVPKIEGRLDHKLLEEWGRRIMAEIAKLLPEDQKPSPKP